MVMGLGFHVLWLWDELPRLGEKLGQGGTKDKSSRAEVQRVGLDFTAVKPFNINGKE